LYYRGEFQGLMRIFRRRRADLMHIYFGHTGVHLLPFIKGWEKPCVVSFHGADVMLREHQPEYEGQLRELLQVTPLVLARSFSLRDRLIALGCPPEKIRINRTGIPLGDFPFKQRALPAEGGWRFVQACRLIPKKGVATSLRAFAIFKKDNPKAEFFIAGKGPLQPELEMLADGLGILRDVHFVGFLSQRKLLELYASSHVFLHPSEISANQDQEGVPNSVLEAMATGLPVVATRHGGIPEAVDHERTGFLVAEEDHVGLANAMQLITRSRDLLAQMGARAHAAVIERFEQETQIEQLESFYEEAISLNGASEPVKSKLVAQLAPQFAEGLPAK
jgi:colanic acid/amylovoran biosynthesis glycosyltransferase